MLNNQKPLQHPVLQYQIPEEKSQKENVKGFINLFIFMKNEHLEQHYYLGEFQTL